MKYMQVDIKEAIKEESISIMNAMIKDGIVSSSMYFNELSASLIYLNYSNPKFKNENSTEYGRTRNKITNIDINLNTVSVYIASGRLYVNSERIPSEKKLNDFKIVTSSPNTYSTFVIEYKLNNLLQKIKL